MGALRDILGYFTRNKFLKEADPEDVLIIGVHTEPDMTGVPAPVPVKDAKLIKIKDLDMLRIDTRLSVIEVQVIEINEKLDKLID